jgi:hypothetical protein
LSFSSQVDLIYDIVAIFWTVFDFESAGYKRNKDILYILFNFGVKNLQNNNNQ